MRCAGWKPLGKRAFSFGEPNWAQCENEASVYLKVLNNGHKNLPACVHCCEKVIEDEKMTILDVEPVISRKKVASHIDMIVRGTEGLVDIGLNHSYVKELVYEMLTENEDYQKLARMILYMTAQA